jgi:hypothetical protein
MAPQAAPGGGSRSLVTAKETANSPLLAVSGAFYGEKIKRIQCVARQIPYAAEQRNFCAKTEE